MHSAVARHTASESASDRGGAMLVGRYCVYGELAKGGTATVHLARLLGPVGFSRIVAIKRPHGHLAADPEFAAMFVDEARLSARVRHANAVNVLDVVVSEVELFLVLEYVHGESLAWVLRKLAAAGERVPVPVAAAIVAGTLQGLHAMHEARDESGQPLGIVHRDVAPQNVLVGVDGIPRIVDLGVAAAAQRLQQTRPGLLKGRLAYMPPERLLGRPPTRQFDVFGAGVILWEALTGQRLFAADTPAAVTERILEGRVPPTTSVFEDIPASLDHVVARALSPDPGDRFATAREMATAIDEAVPTASADQVGAWLARTASESLEARSRLIAAAESGAAREPGARRFATPLPFERSAVVDATVTRTATDGDRFSLAPPESGVVQRQDVAIHPSVGEISFPVARVRSTLLCAGLAALRALGHFERYLGQLDPDGRRWAMTLVPGNWQPITAAMRHFAACERLGLGAEEAFAVGADSSERSQGALLKTIEALHQDGAPMPWPLFEHCPRLWMRMFDGGSVRVTRLGAKHAEVALSDVPFARYAYFRDAFRGTNYAALRQCAPDARVFELAGSATPTSFAIHVVW